MANFNLLGQQANTFLIDSGIGYNEYGTRLVLEERLEIDIVFPSDLNSDIVGEYGYLCVRPAQYNLIDYKQHPFRGDHEPTKLVTTLEFYIAAQVNFVDYKYYPLLDDNNKIFGLVLAKVYKDAVGIPDIFAKSPWLRLTELPDAIVYPLYDAGEGAINNDEWPIYEAGEGLFNNNEWPIYDAGLDFDE